MLDRAELAQLHQLKLPDPDRLDAENSLQIYQCLRPFMPKASMGSYRQSDRLMDIFDQFDALILDGFGVINVGHEKITAIDELFRAAAQKNIPIVVLTNGASQPSRIIWQKYKGWNLNIDEGDIISSRDSLFAYLSQHISLTDTLILGPSAKGFGENLSLDNEGDGDIFSSAHSFTFLGSADWNEDWQQKFEMSLRANPRPVFVGNPDVSAPYLNGFSTEIGYWLARTLQSVDIDICWFGKPYPSAFDLAIARLIKKTGRQLDRKRIAMVGDSLHTDILGGLAAGLSTILVSDYGLLRGRNIEKDIERFAISPDWHVRKI